MAIDYGNCSSLECWYHGNTDRLNEYCEDTDVHCVSNAYDGSGLRSEGIDIRLDEKLPILFTMCGVCWANAIMRSHGTCAKCYRTMIDNGVLVDCRQYCYHCMYWLKIEDLLHEYVPEVMESPDLDHITWHDLRKASHKAGAEKEVGLVYDILRALGLALKADEAVEKIKEQVKAARLVKKRKAVEDAIVRFVPGASRTTCKRIQRVFELDEVPTSVGALLEEVLDRHVSAKARPL